MNPMGYNDFGGYALFQSVQEYKNSVPVPEPGPQPGLEINNKTVRRFGLWQKSRTWVAGLFRAENPAPEIADQC